MNSMKIKDTSMITKENKNSSQCKYNNIKLAMKEIIKELIKERKVK